MGKIINGLKVMLMSAVCSILFYYLHEITLIEEIEIEKISWIATKIGANEATVLWAFIAYILVAWVYLHFGQAFYKYGLKGAVTYSSLIGATWWIGMMELDQSLNNFIMGFVDGIVVVILLIMVYFFVLPKSSKNRNDKFRLKLMTKDNVIEIAIITFVFSISRIVFGVFLGQYFDGIFDYIIIPIYSIIMGIMWIILKPLVGGGRDRHASVKYGFIIWGIPNAIFMYFLPFLLADMFIGMTIRNLMDAVAMTFGTWMVIKFGGDSYE